jgi:cytochrome c2
MLNFKTIGRTVTAGALLLALLVLSSGQAEARPPFVGVFKKAYPELAKNKEIKINCAVCHSTKENKKKKHRNNYGVALKKVLGKKNEKDKEKIAAALKKIAAEKSHVEDKTFGDLIEDGKLPGEDKAAD